VIERDVRWWEWVELLAMLLVLFSLPAFCGGAREGERLRTNAIAADLAAQGYVLQRVEVVGEGARWMVVEQ